MTIDFFAPGIPETAGSKRAYPIKRKDGSLGVAVSDDNKKSAPWKAVVAEAGRRAMQTPAVKEAIGDALLVGPLRVKLVFRVPRPKGDYGTGRNAHLLRPSAPAFPAKRPDVLKLARAVEDALSGVVYLDDAQIYHETLIKKYAAPAGVRVIIEQVPARIKDVE